MRLLNKLFPNINLNGAIKVGEQKEDFLIGDVSQLPVLKKKDTVIFEYHQGKSKDCTLYGPTGAISDLLNKKMSVAFIARVVVESFKRGRRKNKGWFSQSGVRCACDIWNKENPQNTVAYYQIKLTSKQAEEALQKNYTLVVTYKGNRKYDMDYIRDAIITGFDFGKKTYGHCTDMFMRNGVRYIKDSYKGRNIGSVKSNIYEINTPIKKLIGDVFYENAYLIVSTKKNRIEELKRLKDFEISIKSTIAINDDMIKLTNSKIFKADMKKINTMYKKKLEDIQNEFDRLG